MKIGNYMVPIYRLRILLRYIVVFFKEHHDEGITRQQLAKVMNVKESSGGFIQKISDLKNYGLLEQKDDAFYLSDLAKRFANKEGDERNKAIEEAFKHVDVWKNLWEKFGYKVLIDDFSNEISLFTSIPADQIKDNEGKLLNMYVEDVSCFIPYDAIVETIRSLPRNQRYYRDSSDGERGPIEQQSIESIGYIGYPEYSDAPIQIKDAFSYKIAEQLLRAMKQKLIQNGVNFDDTSS